VCPERASLLGCETPQQLREEIARVVPAYAGVETLHATGDAIQVGGERLCAGGVFPTPDGHAHFSVVSPGVAATSAAGAAAPGTFLLSTRRGKQFNSMVWDDVDPLTGAARDALLLCEDDARALDVRAGDRLLVRSPHGEMRARAHLAPIRPGNVQAFFPEANVLLAHDRRDPLSGVPDYNAVVEVVKLG
jgi:anaerobic selenocysteine-containing dehydrogenase